MLTTHAVGIDLGTTYSCIAYLNEHGEPVTLSNQEGELATPSVVMFDEDDVIVGTEALRNAVLKPECVVANAKRYIGSADQKWLINGKRYTPTDISTFILKKLIAAGQEQIGPIEQAVITVPAQFSDAQRHATMEAGHRAGLSRVDIINEPVAAALCYVLGQEGLWFTELAGEQKIMVYDLGGGTFDLSLVRYQKNEVSVIASSGDLHLGGIDWNNSLMQAIAGQFTREFGDDPRLDPSSLQALTLEVEQTKRSLTVRPRAALTVQHGGHRKTYQVELAQFEKLTKALVDRTTEITQKMLKERKLGWQNVDVVLTTGGASRMPMVRESMKKLSGRTLNTSLSPDLSIAHGATYYAGMLLTNSKFAKSILNEKATERLSQLKQRSVNARALGILVRDMETRTRVPHYLIPANTPLPTEATQNFGTVVPNQRRVNLQIVESGISDDKPPAVLGNCVIDDLPPDLPEGSEIAVTIRYDEQARVHVSAKDVASGKMATTELIRSESLVPQLASDHNKPDSEFVMPAARQVPPPVPVSPPPVPRPAAAAPPRLPEKPAAEKPASAKPVAGTPTLEKPVSGKPNPLPKGRPATGGPNVGGLPVSMLEDADRPVPLCNECGEPLDARGVCKGCGATAKKAAAAAPPAGGAGKPRPTARPAPASSIRSAPVPPPIDDEILELDAGKPGGQKAPAQKPASRPPAARPAPKPAPVPSAAGAAAKPAAAPRPAGGKPAAGPKPSVRPSPKPSPVPKPKDQAAQGEDEFWQMVE